MAPLIHILHLEDDAADAQLIQTKIEEAGLDCRITRVQTRDGFDDALQRNRYNIILADYRLPMFDGVSALRLAQEKCPEIPVIFVSGTTGEEAAIEGLTQGATDYVLKQNLSGLGSAVKRALQEARKQHEHRQAQKELQRSNEMLRAIIEAAPVAIICLDPDGNVHSVWNPAAEKMLGWSAQDVLGRAQHTIPMDREEEFKRFRQQIRNGMTLDGVEMRRQRRDGTPIEYSIYASPLQDAQGRIGGNIAVLVDITERKQAEAALKASEVRYIDLYENAPDMYVSVNAKTGRIEQCNRTLINALGYSKEEIIGRPEYEIYHPDCLNETRKAFRSFLETGELHDKELQLRKKDGSKLDVSLNVSAVRAGDGSILFSRSTLRDISERKQAEQQVVLMSFALNAIHEAAIMIDEKARIQYVNDEACRLLGYSRNELLTMGMADINPDFPMDRWPGHWSNLEKHRALTFEGQFKTRDGRIFTVELNANYFEHDGQNYDLCLARDITERKQAERERLANLRFFESMDRVNRAIQGADDLEKMMKDLLDQVLSIFDCDRASLVYPCDPESPTWTCPMERNKPEYSGLWDLKMEMPMDPQIAEKHRILLAADGPVAFGPGAPHGLPEDVSKQFGIKCMMSMAIYPKTGSPWQFGIHQCAYARVWTAEEMRMLEAIGWRLADSLSSLLAYRDLRKNEEFLNNVVEHIPNMIFVKDAQTLRFVRFNKAGEQLVGYSREKLLGKTDHDFFPKVAADFFTAEDRQVLATRTPVDIAEETIRNRCNEERILRTQKIPILDEAGTPRFLLGISEDITERKRAEESVRKLSQAIEQSPVSIIITDAAGNIEFVNTKFTQITGYSFSESLGRNPRILKSGKTPSEEYRQLWATISSGGVWSGEFHNRKKNGELFREQATIAPVRNADKVITHYVAVKEDITERKKLEEQLRQAQKMEAVGQLAGGVAHDFNNMLAVIMGHAELALYRIDPANPLFGSLQGIRNAAERSADLIRQLLAFARKQTVLPKVLDLNETIKGMLKMLRRLIGEDIELAWQPAAKVWPVKMDPSQIDQILANLCVNARDAIAGVGKVIIETQNAGFEDDFCAEHPGFAPGEYVLLAVSDDGCGMDQETRGKIFEPFFTTKEIGQGTGLGLATVYGIAKQNNGFVYVFSEPGHGSTFKIYLPRHADATGPKMIESPASPVKRGDETILLVEDEASMLEMTMLMLEGCGYRVLAASTPGKAIRVAEAHKGGIHLLLTDVIMPGMNGRDLERHLIALYPQIKCLFMSGYSGNVIAHHGVLDDGVHFIQKPFLKQALTAKVREVLDGNCNLIVK